MAAVDLGGCSDFLDLGDLLRGQLVDPRDVLLRELVDLGVIVDGVATPVRMASRIVVVELEADLFSGRPMQIGILVPEILGMSACDFDGEGAHPGFAFAGASHLGPTTVDAEGMVQLLRCRRMLEGDAALRELPLQGPA